MDDLMRIAGVGIVTVILVALLKVWRPEVALPVAMAGGLIMFGLAVVDLKELITEVVSFGQGTGLPKEELSVLLKITGIAYLADFAAGICKDAGESSLAARIELGGKICILSLSFPLAVSLLGMVEGLLIY